MGIPKVIAGVGVVGGAGVAGAELVEHHVKAAHVLSGAEHISADAIHEAGKGIHTAVHGVKSVIHTYHEEQVRDHAAEMAAKHHAEIAKHAVNADKHVGKEVSGHLNGHASRAHGAAAQGTHHVASTNFLQGKLARSPFAKLGKGHAQNAATQTHAQVATTAAHGAAQHAASTSLLQGKLVPAFAKATKQAVKRSHHVAKVGGHHAGIAGFHVGLGHALAFGTILGGPVTGAIAGVVAVGFAVHMIHKHIRPRLQQAMATNTPTPGPSVKKPDRVESVGPSRFKGAEMEGPDKPVASPTPRGPAFRTATTHGVAG